MTLYRLKQGGDMVTLNVTIGKDTHSVSTVKVGGSGRSARVWHGHPGACRQRVAR